MWTDGAAAEDFAAGVRLFTAEQSRLRDAALLEGPAQARSHDWKYLAAQFSDYLLQNLSRVT